MTDSENKKTNRPDGDDHDEAEGKEVMSENESATKGIDDTEQIRADLEKIKNDMLYMQADFENYKKRVFKERSDLMKYGSENLVRALLDLLDNFERAMSVEIKPENLQSFVSGVQMIATEFKNVLNRFGVTEVKALGETFDPNVHEALGKEPSADFKPGTISKVYTKPYKLYDRVIRPGRVIVAEAPKAENKDG